MGATSFIACMVMKASTRQSPSQSPKTVYSIALGADVMSMRMLEKRTLEAARMTKSVFSYGFKIEEVSAGPTLSNAHQSFRAPILRIFTYSINWHQLIYIVPSEDGMILRQKSTVRFLWNTRNRPTTVLKCSPCQVVRLFLMMCDGITVFVNFVEIEFVRWILSL